MTPEELKQADGAKLRAERLRVLRRLCQSCDFDREVPCTCDEDLAEAAVIEQELNERGEPW